MNKKYLLILVLIIVVIGTLFIAKIISPEDTWLCQNGQWIKHGNPSAPMPETGCGGAQSKPVAEQMADMLNQKFNRPANTITTQLITDTGEFAKGSFNEANAGGGLWFAAKTAEGWQLAFDGNGIVPCDAANRYNFPKDIIPQCIDTQNDNNLIQR
ncbi:MAG: hypothetical protein P4L74_05740 [Candidatus Doudnabacteria bacterium]|nr:hypothetical protein [Candidatus Doudnabacteria bacterium]